MWPLLLDMTKEESFQNLRNLELEAYSHLVSALRAQGPLNSDKKKLLKDTSDLLNITQDRYKAEIRRALNDEKLNTIAYHVTGQSEPSDDWAQEGRRTVPLLPRMAPQTVYSALADEVSDNAVQMNKQLPIPSNTERKRNAVQSQSNLGGAESSGKSPLPFRIPEPPKVEENKKRKLPVGTENSSLAQHLLGPAKISKIQQIYRQRTKAKSKEQRHKQQDQQMEHQSDFIHQRMMHHPSIAGIKYQSSNQPPSTSGSKINVLQNISLHSMPSSSSNNEPDHQQPYSETPYSNPPSSTSISSLSPTNNNPLGTSSDSPSDQPATPTYSRPKPMKTNVTMKQVSPTTVSTTASPSELQKTIKVCTPKKALTKTVNSQKLIVVSNAQTMPSSSILQRTLSIPFVKNISVRNFDKFKIVTSNSNSNVQSTAPVNSTSNSVKHKVVTVRTNPNKKLIPISQLQVLNSKGGTIKVLPMGGKLLGKPMTAVTNASPLYIVNPVVTQAKPATNINIPEKQEGTNDFVKLSPNKEAVVSSSPSRENGKTTALEELLLASGVANEEVTLNNEEVKDEIKYEPDETNGQEVVSAMEDSKEEITVEEVVMESKSSITCEEIVENENTVKMEEETVEYVTENCDLLMSETTQEIIVEANSLHEMTDFH